MPYSFTQIEKDKTNLIGFIFLFLVLFYFVSIEFIYWISINGIAFSKQAYNSNFHLQSLDVYQIFLALVVAFLAGALHWYISINGLVEKIIRLLKAERLDVNNADHLKFKNILDEVSVASGGLKIEGVVIPTMGMNAFALADFEHTPVIGVTQGLLSRLGRSQLEAVVAHEAAHIAQEDCILATVTTSLFGVFNTILTGLGQTVTGAFLRMDSSDENPDAKEVTYALLQVLRIFPSAVVGIFLLFIIYIILMFASFVGYLFRMFLSREREFRADAVAVRLTRDPLSLAEALYIMAHRWRGAGAPWEVLDAIFIMNPSYGTIDEEEGWGADLFSTHPPVMRRIEVLLDMAHGTGENLKKVLDEFNVRYKEESSVLEFKWFVLKDVEWIGPLTLLEIMSLTWITPSTMVKRFGSQQIIPASDDKTLADVLRRKMAIDAQKPRCPRCQCDFNEVLYEGLNILTCSQCHGTLVAEDQLGIILYRRNVSFTSRIMKMAQVIQKEQKIFSDDALRLYPSPGDIHCPKCKNLKYPMGRRLFNRYFHVEVDKCGACGAIWFDRDELEILQYLSEHAQDT